MNCISCGSCARACREQVGVNGAFDLERTGDAAVCTYCGQCVAECTGFAMQPTRLISRYTGQVIIAYDNDGAGQKAAQRAIGILEKLDLKVKVLQMSGAKDPDEFIKIKGPEAFQMLI